MYRPAPAAGAAREWRTPTAPDLVHTLGVLRRGPADPAFRVTADGAVWRVSRTPCGPATLRVSARAAERVVRGEAWGPGADWLLAALPALAGAEDEDAAAAFVPRHRVLADVLRRRPGLRLCRTGLVLESLVPAVLEQKVTAEEAYRGWRLLLRRFGEPAPGPVPDPRMRVPLPARGWAAVPSWEWHRAGVDAKRAGTVVRAARLGARLETLAALPAADASARLRTVTGIGPWTAAETVQRTHGAADEVTLGDLHLPRTVVRVLGVPAVPGPRGAEDGGAADDGAEAGAAEAGGVGGEDAAMLRALEPYGGQRHRACRLAVLGAPRERRTRPRAVVRDFRAM